MQDAQMLVQQIDDLTKQNNLLTNELKDIRQKLQLMQQQGGGSAQQPNGSSGQAPAQGQSGGQQASGGQGQAQQNQASPSGGGSSSSNPSVQLAGELKKLKGMVQDLESRMSDYVSLQSSGKLTQPDVVNLLLTVMDGMIDWSVDFVSSQKQASQSQGNQNQSGQNQSSGQNQGAQSQGGGASQGQTQLH